jgi:hypothetical protein
VKRSAGLYPVFAASLLKTFRDYLTTLVQWEGLLLDNLELTVSPYKILATLDSNDAIYSASDGSGKGHQGRVGWLLSSSDGTVILKWSSPA